MRSILLVLACGLAVDPSVAQTVTRVAPTVVAAVPAGAMGPFPVPTGAFTFFTTSGPPVGGFFYDATAPAMYVVTASTAYRFPLPAPLASWIWS